MADSNRVSLISVPEVTYGTTPVDSDSWQQERFTQESLGGEINTTQSGEIRSDRMIADFPKTGTSVKGALTGEFSADTWDAYLEAVMGGVWTTDVLKVGVLDYSFSMQKQFQDLTTAYLQMRGMRVDSVDLSFEFGGLSTIAVNFAGAGYATATTSLVGAGSVLPATTTGIFNGSADISNIKIDGVTSTACFKKIGLSIKANLRPRECLGNDAPDNQIKGSLGVSGDFSVYLKDLSLEQKKIDNTPFKLQFDVSNTDGGYTFLLPKLKFGGSTPSAGGKDQDVLLEGSYEALYDSTTGTSLQITRGI